ncbi:VanZ family protein [Enterococcus sp. 669A]|uniref:VanZ family protein n=1 Tax=Candidatus Enterococcus moelleringii TaxID=2815325 RepID=A0ABS3LFU9_9ENTE|nr:VanZ family protein [Enterococcus sp. 669A]
MKTQKSGRILLVVYLLVLVWILLFKLAFSWSDLQGILNNGRSINLIPFQASAIVNGKISLTEIFYNFVVFLPFGGLLGIAVKNRSFLSKCFLIAGFSLTIEVLQFILGVGATDITDLLVNTAGGITGLLIYQLLRRIFSETKLDRFLTILGTILFILCLGFILFIMIYNMIL